ncbi:MAG: hypothetical protein CR997_12940 [Acidobacteria bacterium]|nr:MAG: hypothetical protein CR997_12940 [Acidobacteriota bacterium]
MKNNNPIFFNEKGSMISEEENGGTIVITCTPGSIVTRWVALLPFFCKGLFASWLFLPVEWCVPGMQDERHFVDSHALELSIDSITTSTSFTA